jgi:hypothetical protein
MPDPIRSEVERPPPDATAPIAFVYSQPEASVLVCTLRAYGIIAFAFDYGTISVMPPWMVALGGIRVAIPASQWEDAIALLSEIDEGWACPPRAYASEAWVSIGLSLISFFLGAGPPPPRARGLYAWRRRQAESGSGAR